MLNLNNNNTGIEDFFLLYPQLMPKTESEDTNKFLHLFTQKSAYILKKGSTKDFSGKKKVLRANSITNIEPIKIIKTNLPEPKMKNIYKDSLDSFSQKNTNQYYEKNLKETEKNNNDLEDKQINNERENNNNPLEFEKPENIYLIKKCIFLQENRQRRSEDVRRTLESFLMNSTLIEKLSNNLNVIETRLKSSKNRDSISGDKEIQNKIQKKLNNIVLKLSKRVVVKVYPKNSFVVKMNERGDDCFFLISGKLSILKPVEHIGVRMSYKDYFIYLKNLINLDDIELVLKTLNSNKKFLNVSSLDVLVRLIRANFVLSLKKELNKNVGGIKIEEVEDFFRSYNFTFEDFRLTRKKILDDIKYNINDKNHKSTELLWNYLSEKINISQEDLFLIDSYRVFDNGNGNERKFSLILYKYENFLFLYPGSFFGDAALESKMKKRNATIRTEEDSVICSLSNEYYVSLLSEENRKLKTVDLIFLCHNFFFDKISPVLFNKYYYPMFKVTEKIKSDIIYKQGENNNSVFLLKEGVVKLEIFANVLELLSLMKNIFKELFAKNNYFKVTTQQIMELKHNYFYDSKLSRMCKKEQFLLEAANKMNFELSTTNGYECLGILEFCLKMKRISKCQVISDRALIMEIKRDDLAKMLKNENEILPSYYKFVFNKILAFIKRIHYLKNYALSQIDINIKESQNKENFIVENNATSKNKNAKINTQGNNYHKQNIGKLEHDKMKQIYSEKKTSLESNKNSNNNTTKYFSMTDRSHFSPRYSSISTKKNVLSYDESTNKNNNSNNKPNHYKKICLKNRRRVSSAVNDSPTEKEVITSISRIQDGNSTMSFSKNINNSYKNKILMNGESNTNMIRSVLMNIKKKLVKEKNNNLKNDKETDAKSKETKGSGRYYFINKFIYPFDEEKSYPGLSFYYLREEKKENHLNKINLKKNMGIIHRKHYLFSENNLFMVSNDDELSNNKPNINIPMLIKKDNYNSNNQNSKIDLSDTNIKLKETLVLNNKIVKQTKENEMSNSKQIDSSKHPYHEIKNINRKIQSLIGEMKEKYAIKNGQTKFIFYRKSRKNEIVFNSLKEKTNNNNSSKRKIIGQGIRDFYYQKKYKGYSSLLNPAHNTYINRQRTISIKRK